MLERLARILVAPLALALLATGFLGFWRHELAKPFPGFLLPWRPASPIEATPERGIGSSRTASALASAPPPSQPSIISRLFRSQKSQQVAALLAIRRAETDCAVLQDGVSGAWRAAIDLGMDGQWGVETFFKDGTKAEIATKARSARDAASAAMQDSSMREGEAGPALLDYYASSQQLCAIALSPAGYSLVTYNGEASRLTTAAAGFEARLSILLAS